MNKIDFQLWKDRLEIIQEVFDRKSLSGGQYHYDHTLRSIWNVKNGPAKIHVGPPASLHEVEKAEETLGFRLPSSLRNVFLNFSGSFMVSWFVDDHSILKKDQQLDITWGFCLWNLAEIVHANYDYELYFPNLSRQF